MALTIMHQPNGPGYKRKCAYGVEADEAGFTLRFAVSGFGHVGYSPAGHELRIDYADYDGKASDIVLANNNRENVVQVWPMMDKQTPRKMLAWQQREDDALPIAEFFVDGGDCWLLPSFVCDDIPGFENITLDMAKESYIGALQRVSPAFAEKRRLYGIKQTMINDVDIYATITYLETQVDALTRLALEQGVDDGDIKAILEAADAHSVLDIKGAAKAIAEIDKDKAKIRRLQVKLYADKQKDTP